MVSNLAADVGAFTSNVFLVGGDRTVLVDPGANFDVVSRLRGRVEGLDGVVLTHTHPDHVGNLEAVVEAFDPEVAAYDPGVAGVTRSLEDGDRIRIGDHDYRVLHTPGHAPDHLCLYSPEASVLFAGDLVFGGGGFGRTDLSGADRATLVESIVRLADEVDPDLGEMHAGHGPSVFEDPHGQIELAGRTARQV